MSYAQVVHKRGGGFFFTLWYTTSNAERETPTTGRGEGRKVRKKVF